MRKVLLSVTLSLFSFILAYSQVNVGDSTALVNIFNNNGGSGWLGKDGWLVTAPERVRVSEWEGIVVMGDRVVAVDLPFNNLTGTFPADDISALTALASLDLSGNSALTGNIPATLPESLVILDLSGCNLNGTIPAGIGTNASLLVVNLSNNNLSGSLPAFDNPALSELIVSDNSLGNPFPSISSPLTTLFISNNNFSGVIPATITDLSTLGELRINGNNFSGSIPTSVSNLQNATNLDFSYNSLTGSIPGQFADIPVLHTLRLNNNQLSGTLPAGLASLSSFSNLIVNDNQLTGPVPASYCTHEFDTLRLSNNLFDFAGMECLAANDLAEVLEYTGQKTLTITKTDDVLSVDAGGTVANNTYQWYRNNSPISPATTGNNNLTITEDGTYRVEVTNSVVSGLTLTSADLLVEVLPLDWLSFTIRDCNGSACLEWKTQNEVNTATFEIENSRDGIHYSRVTTLNARNTPGHHTYQYTDESPAYGTSYYRIKQLDLDGRYTYSKTEQVTIIAANNISVTPNPAYGFVKLRGIEKADRVTITNIAGQQLKEWRNVNGNQSLDISSIPNGIYIIKVTGKQTEKAFKIIKQ